MTTNFVIPESFADVRYVAQRIPGVENQADLRLGANCQVYAYAFLRHFGLAPPELLRSSELWADTEFTIIADDFQWLDLMLYNKTQAAYGAHVGVYVGDGQVLHLAQAIGHPIVQQHEDLLLEDKYACFIGAKRVLSASG